MNIRQQRQIISQYLLTDDNIVDAPTAYYALYHDPKRSELRLRLRPSGRPEGFAGRFQTGYDLFRPLVTMRARTPEAAADLLAELLTPDRPYIFFATGQQLPLIGGSFEILNQRALHIYYLDTRKFHPRPNVMVVERAVPGGPPRFEIHSGELMAVAGLNWQSPGFAELYVYTEPMARKRGWGRSVLSACSEYVLRGGRLPLYLVEADNAESIALAEAVGFVNSGAQQVLVEGIYRGHPAPQNQPVEEENKSSR
ncbi:MAG: GNAT family N-acetyltransferase [Anaerolineae bacterium]|nr:GNAT family N-acetyltransferase [Anaerolineae bacterium]